METQDLHKYEQVEAFLSFVKGANSRQDFMTKCHEFDSRYSLREAGSLRNTVRQWCRSGQSQSKSCLQSRKNPGIHSRPSSTSISWSSQDTTDADDPASQYSHSRSGVAVRAEQPGKAQLLPERAAVFPATSTNASSYSKAVTATRAVQPHGDGGAQLQRLQSEGVRRTKGAVL